MNFENLDFINLGGRLPVVYNPDTDRPMPLLDWSERLSNSFAELSKIYGKDVRLEIGPGRYVVAESDSLISEIQNIKETPGYTFALLNTGFNHNPRLDVYGSYHPITAVSGNDRALNGRKEYVIADYLCESGDIFTHS